MLINIIQRFFSYVAEFFNYINSQHSCIKFTFDFEYNNQLNFFDVKITKRDNSFQTSVFRKATFSRLGLQIEYFSNKDKLPIPLVSSVIYQYSCGQGSACYS